jgi:TetR/AcrR family transcriptional regulator, cholesterol catabolism regulator
VTTQEPIVQDDGRPLTADSFITDSLEDGEVPTRTRLTIEAGRLFAERGFHGTSIRELAKAVGIDPSSIYAHISAKEDLLAQLALSGAAAFHGALDDLEKENAPPSERLRLALRAHVKVVQKQIDVATVWLREWRYLTGDAREAFLVERRRYEHRIRLLFQDVVACGEARPDLDVRYAALLFLSAANWTYTWLTHETDVDDSTATLWALLENGIKPSEGPAVSRDYPQER